MAEWQDNSCDNTNITIGRPQITGKKEDILSLRRLNCLNCDPLSTEENLSPLQLYTEGLVAIQQDTLPHSSTDQSGITSGSTINDQLSNGVEIVEVPSNKFIPCSQLLILLQCSIDPLSQCADLGKQFYYTCIQIVGQHLQGKGCNICTLECCS